MNIVATTDEKTAGLHFTLQQLEANLSQRIRGQNHVIPRVVSILQRGELGLTKVTRPKGSFLFPRVVNGVTDLHHGNRRRLSQHRNLEVGKRFGVDM